MDKTITKYHGHLDITKNFSKTEEVNPLWQPHIDYLTKFVEHLIQQGAVATYHNNLTDKAIEAWLTDVNPPTTGQRF